MAEGEAKKPGEVSHEELARLLRLGAKVGAGLFLLCAGGALGAYVKAEITAHDVAKLEEQHLPETIAEMKATRVTRDQLSETTAFLGAKIDGVIISVSDLKIALASLGHAAQQEREDAKEKRR